MQVYQVYGGFFVADGMSGFRKEGCFAVSRDVYSPASEPSDFAPFP